MFLLVVGGIGCTTNATITTTGPGVTNTGNCNADSTVSCSQGAGYSCDSGITPDESNPTLACSSGRVTASGLVAYCCAASGFPTSSSCSADASVTGCQVGSYGYACTGSTRPEDVDTSLVCSAGVPSAAANSYDYCCETAATVTNACGADPTVTGCVGGSTGYTCVGTATPDATLDCSAGVPGVGQTTVYCCGGTSAGSCAADTTVTGCATGSAGYSCSGVARPDADGTLQCSSGVPTADGASTAYCCYSAPTATSTCTVDSTVTGCTGGSYGFACTGTDTPADSNTSLVCGPGAAGNDGNTLYCCASK